MPTLSKLSLHLYTFDFAVSQYNANRDLNKDNSSKKSNENEAKNMEKPGKEKEKSTNSGKRKQNQLPSELRHLGLKERMKTVIKWARQSGVPLHEGDTDDDCYICNNGGFVLCCEFCVNVAHPECIGFKGKSDDIDWDWVCDLCVQDIYNVTQKKARG